MQHNAFGTVHCDALWSTAPRSDIEPPEVRQVKPQKPQKGGGVGAAIHRQYLTDLVLCLRSLQLQKHQRPVSVLAVMSALNVQQSTMQLMLKDAQNRGLIVIRDRDALVANDRIGSIFHSHERPRECVLYFPSDETFCRELQRDNEGGEREIYADVSPPASSRRAYERVAPPQQSLSSDDELTSAMERLEAKTSRRATPPSTARSTAAAAPTTTTSLSPPVVALERQFAVLEDVAVVSSSSGTDTPTPSMVSTRKSAEPARKHNRRTSQHRTAQRSEGDSSGDAVVIKQSSRQASAYKLHTDLKKSTSMRSMGNSSFAAVEGSRSGPRMHASSVLSSAREEARQLFTQPDDEHVDVTPSRSHHGSTGGYLHRKQRSATVIVSAEGRRQGGIAEGGVVDGGGGATLESSSRSPSMLMGTRLTSSAALERRSSSMMMSTIPSVFVNVEELIASEELRRIETIKRYDGVMGVLSAQARVELSIVLSDLATATLAQETDRRLRHAEEEVIARSAISKLQWADARAQLTSTEASHRMMLCLRCLLPAQDAVLSTIRRQQNQARCMLLLAEVQAREGTLRCANEGNAILSSHNLLQIEKFDAVSLKGLERTVVQAEQQQFRTLVADALYAQKCIDATALWSMETTGPDVSGDLSCASEAASDASARLLLVRNMFLEDERMQREHMVERAESDCWATIVALQRCTLEQIHDRWYLREAEERALHGLYRVHLMRSEEGQRSSLERTAKDIQRRIMRLELCAREPFSRHSVAKALLLASHDERLCLKQRMFEDVEAMHRHSIVDLHYTEVLRMVVSFTDDVGEPHSRGADAQQRLMMRVYYWQRKSLLHVEAEQRQWLVGVEALQGDIARTSSMRVWESSVRSRIEAESSSARRYIHMEFIIADESIWRWSVSKQCVTDLSLMNLECCETTQRDHLLTHIIRPEQWSLRMPTVLFFEVVARYFLAQEEQRRRRHRCIVPFVDVGEAISRRRIAGLENDAYKQNLAPRMEDHAEQMSVATHALRQLYRIVIADEHLHRRLLFTRFSIGLKKLLVADFYEEEAFDRWDVIVPTHIDALERTLRRHTVASEASQRLSLCATALEDAHQVAGMPLRQREGTLRSAITAQQGNAYRQLFLGEVFSFTATRIAIAEAHEYLRNVLIPAATNVERIQRWQVDVAYHRAWRDAIMVPLLEGLEPLVRVRNVEHWEQTFRFRNVEEPERRGQLAATFAATYRQLIHDVRLGAVVLAETRDRGHIYAERARSLFDGSLARRALADHAAAAKRAQYRLCVLEALAIRADQLHTEELYLRRCLVAEQDRAMWLQRGGGSLCQGMQNDALVRRNSKVTSNPFCDVVCDDTAVVESASYVDVSDAQQPPAGYFTVVARMLHLEHVATNPLLRFGDIAAIEGDERMRTVVAPFADAIESIYRQHVRQLEVVAREAVERVARERQGWAGIVALVLQRLAYTECLTRGAIVQGATLDAEALHWSGPCEASARHCIASQEAAVYVAVCSAEVLRLEVGQRRQLRALETAERDAVALEVTEIVYRYRCMLSEHEHFFIEALGMVDALAIVQNKITARCERHAWHMLSLEISECTTRGMLEASALHPRAQWQLAEAAEREVHARHAIHRRARRILDTMDLLASEGRHRLMLTEQEAAVAASNRGTFHVTNCRLLSELEERTRREIARDEHESFALAPCMLEELNGRHALDRARIMSIAHLHVQCHFAVEALGRKALQLREHASFAFRSLFWAEARGRLQSKQEENEWFARFALKATFVLDTASLEETATRTITEFANSSPKRLREDVLLPICVEEESASRNELACDGIVSAIQLRRSILTAMESLHRRQCIERPYDMGRRTAWFDERAMHDRVEVASDARRGYESLVRGWRGGWFALQTNALAAQMALAYKQMHRQQLLLHIRRLQIFTSATEQTCRMQVDALRDEELRPLRIRMEIASTLIAERTQRSSLTTSAWHTSIRNKMHALMAHETLHRREMLEEPEHASVFSDVLFPFAVSAEATRRMEIVASQETTFSRQRNQFCSLRALQEATETEEQQRQQLMAQHWTTLIRSQRSIVVELEHVHRQQWHLLPLRQYVCATLLRSQLLQTEAREATARTDILSEHLHDWWCLRLACEATAEEVQRFNLLQRETTAMASFQLHFSHGRQRLALCQQEAQGRDTCLRSEWHALYGIDQKGTDTAVPECVCVSELVVGGEAIARRGIGSVEDATWVNTALRMVADMREPAHRVSLSEQLEAEFFRLQRYVGCSIDMCILACIKEPRRRGPIEVDAWELLLVLQSRAVSGHEAVERAAILQEAQMCRSDLQRRLIDSEEHCSRVVSEQTNALAYEEIRRQHTAGHAQALCEQTLREEVEAAQVELASLDASNTYLFDDLKERMVSFQLLEQTRREERAMSRAHRRAVKELARVQSVLAAFGDADRNAHFVEFAEQDAEGTNVVQQLWIACPSPDPRHHISAFENPDFFSGDDDADAPTGRQPHLVVPPPPEVISVSADAPSPIPSRPHPQHHREQEPQVAHPLFPNSPRAGGSALSLSPIVTNREESSAPATLDPASFVVPPLDLLPRRHFETGNIADRARLISSRLQSVDTLVERCQRCKQETVVEQMQANDALRGTIRQAFQRELALIEAKTRVVERYETEVVHHIHRGTGTSSDARPRAAVEEYHAALATEARSLLRASALGGGASEVAALRQHVAEAKRDANAAKAELGTHEREHKQSMVRLKRDLHASQRELEQLDKEVAEWREHNAQLRERHLIALAARNSQRLETAKQKRQQTPRRVPTPRSARGHPGTTTPTSSRGAANQTPRNATPRTGTPRTGTPSKSWK